MSAGQDRPSDSIPYGDARAINMGVLRGLLRGTWETYFPDMSYYAGIEATVILAYVLELDAKSEPATVHQLADYFGLSLATVYRKLREYERRGFITRQEHVVRIRGEWLRNERADEAHMRAREMVVEAGRAIERISQKENEAKKCSQKEN